MLETIYMISKMNENIPILAGFTGDNRPIYLYTKRYPETNDCGVFSPFLKTSFKIHKEDDGTYQTYTLKDKFLNSRVIEADIDDLVENDYYDREYLHNHEIRKFALALANLSNYGAEITIAENGVSAYPIRVKTNIMTNLSFQNIHQIEVFVESDEMKNESIQFLVNKSSQNVIYAFTSSSKVRKIIFGGESPYDYDIDNNADSVEKEISDLIRII